MASTSTSVEGTTPTFPSVISRVLRAWTAYQYALRAQMGGSATREKAAWFESVLAEYFATNRNLQVDEVMDWVDEILYNEFDLIVEDGSVEWLADALIKCYGWLGNERYDQVNALLTRLPSDSAVSAATSQSTTAGDDEGESDSGEDDQDGASQTPTNNLPPPSSSQPASNNSDQPADQIDGPDPDGWTTVTKKGRRK